MVPILCHAGCLLCCFAFSGVMIFDIKAHENPFLEELPFSNVVAAARLWLYGDKSVGLRLQKAVAFSQKM